MKSRRIIEAIDLGGDPDAIHPQHRQALRTGQHPLGKVPPFTPHEAPTNAAERHASQTYRNVIAKLRAFGGIVPRGRQDANRCGIDMMRTLQDVMRREDAHKDALKQLAVETVLRLPEFKTLRRALQAGNLRIEPYLGESPDLTDVQTEEPEGQPEEPEAIRAEYDEMVAKRKMLNTMMQGAAVANNYKFAEVAFDELHDIDPGIVQDYGKLMAYSELGQFMQGTEVAAAAAQAQGSEAQGGGARLKKNEDGSTSVVAVGLTFPILVQEIIKGVMEYLSMTDEDDPETINQVQKRADFIGDEQYQMQVGPNIWREFIDAIGGDAAEVMPYVYDELNRMPVSDYNQKMRGLVQGTPEGKLWLRQLAQKIKQEIESEPTEEALSVVRHLLP